MTYVTVTVLLGQTLKEVTRVGDEEIIFVTETGIRYKMYHKSDCCECVEIESIVGDLNDLIGSPILMAEEVTSEDVHPEGVSIPVYVDDSFTWTFYKFATIK